MTKIKLIAFQAITIRIAKNLKFQAKQQRKADARIKDASKIEPPSVALIVVTHEGERATNSINAFL